MVQAAGSVRHYRVESRERVSFYGGWGALCAISLSLSQFHSQSHVQHITRCVHTQQLVVLKCVTLNRFCVIFCAGPGARAHAHKSQPPPAAGAAHNEYNRI